jgi:hypothetical protein
MLGLTRIHLIIIGSLLAAVLTAGGIAWVFHKGESAGAGKVTTAVQEKTIQALDAARISKEKTDAEVHGTPYGERADGLR